MPSKSMAYAQHPTADPAASVFVSAHAGSGKTRLLTHRVLSLLLAGVSPAKILCLTYTNAAAAEMTGRVLETLGDWVMMEEGLLTAALTEIIGSTPYDVMSERARSLFATVLEAPEGIRIQTLHGFCQSLLRRFPIEANISPHFTVMDARTEQELLGEARVRLFNRAQSEDPKLQAAISGLASDMSEAAFHDLLDAIAKSKQKLQALLHIPNGWEDAGERVWRFLGVNKHTTPASLIAGYFTYDDERANVLRTAAKLLLAGGKTDLPRGETIAAWMASPEKREILFDDYTRVFLTEKGEPRKTLSNKGTITDEGIRDVLQEEQESVFLCNDKLKALTIAQRTSSMLRIAQALLALYEEQKTARALMDYDDLILTSLRLLQQPGAAPWVLFKLDGGIDHILVDEAQDTSPQQWEIVRALTQEFFAGEGRAEADRSLFVVGDEKQSIFSFQGADPAGLGRAQDYFSQRIDEAGKTVHRVALTRSYRSTPEILQAVDMVFAQATALDGLTYDETATLSHTAHRSEIPGLVELWPLITPPQEEDGPRLLPAVMLARTIASAVAGWLKEGSAQPGDIMILVRTRTRLVDRIMRALRRQGVPVAGLDRMALSDNLAVQDLVALGQCLLLPDDDLTLAAILKSPIFDISEEDLFTLAYGRGEQSLWERLSSCGRHSSNAGSHTMDSDPVQSLRASQDKIALAYELLTGLRAKADFVPPYELYAHLLDTLGVRKRFTGRMGEEYGDPIDEFLTQTLLYERSHPPSLQGFLHWLSASDSEIKRDMEQAHGQVRIMTIHGAKGLEAPIVILPDTIEKPTLKDKLLWRDEPEMSVPFWPGGEKRQDSLCASMREDAKLAMMREYRRLLYVALTRAADRLYICGSSAKETIAEDCWYSLIKSGLAPVATPFETGWGEGLRLGSSLVIPAKAGILNDLQDPCFRRDDNNNPKEDLSFLLKPTPPEPIPPRPLTPSRLAGEEPPSASPLTSADVYKRGTFIHTLLQYLPAVAQAERADAGARLAAHYRTSLDEHMLAECIHEVLAVIDDPQFSFLFGEGSLAEVPIAGCVYYDGRQVAVAGQIDRLYIGEKEVWIVDYKSNRAVPQKIPAAYARQMALYRLLLTKMYPEKTVRCALLWTSAAKLVPLGEALLDEAALSSYI